MRPCSSTHLLTFFPTLLPFVSTKSIARRTFSEACLQNTPFKTTQKGGSYLYDFSARLYDISDSRSFSEKSRRNHKKSRRFISPTATFSLTLKRNLQQRKSDASCPAVQNDSARPAASPLCSTSQLQRAAFSRGTSLSQCPSLPRAAEDLHLVALSHGHPSHDPQIYRLCLS